MNIFDCPGMWILNLEVQSYIYYYYKNAVIERAYSSTVNVPHIGSDIATDSRLAPQFKRW
jgi:hypothetical protein